MKTDITEFVAVGDIAGRYLELMKIRQHFPPELPIICVGDPNDRGPMSKQVIEFFMNSKNDILIQSNHGHMLIDFCENSVVYENNVFLMNGGVDTLRSFGAPQELLLSAAGLAVNIWNSTLAMPEKTEKMEVLRRKLIKSISKEYVEFLKSNPMYVEGIDFIITHAPINPTLPIEEEVDFTTKYSRPCKFLWNRGSIGKRSHKLQIHGHNSLKDVKVYDEEGVVWGLNIDTSRDQKLTGVHIKDGKVIEVKSVPYYEDLNNGSK